MTPVEAAAGRELVLEQLARQRARSWFLRGSGALLLLLVAYTWLGGGFHWSDFTSERRLANLGRFLGELAPRPLQGRDWDWAVALRWLSTLMASRGWLAVSTTVAISVAAIALAGVAGAVLALPATRTLASPEPYLPDVRPPSVFTRAFWKSVVSGMRLLLIFLRAVPEYVWAFLLVGVVGPTAWAAVLALALHNTGILAKLDAEVIENLGPEPLAGLRATGASRLQIALTGIIPAILPRALLLFFYRWETCVREATVLGMLGIISLGYYVQDARARQQYDVVLTLILLGSVIVVAGDLISALARELVRRSR